MIIIEDNTHLLNNDEKVYLEDKCKNFTISELPDKNSNYYIRSFLNKDTKYSKTIINKINLYLTKYFHNFNVEPDNIWINKVDSTTNKKDTFHTDKSHLTFIMYLNDDFTGGEYEYKNLKDNIKKIYPKKYMSIVTNSNVSHKVLPVTNGVRYSLVVFYDASKEIKSII